MTARQTTRATCLLLMAALVHQLGAAPCGCLEHNGWRQSVVALLGGAPSHDHGDNGVHAADCEHLPALTALAPARVATPDSADEGHATTASLLGSRTAPSTAGRSPSARRSAANLAPPVRAKTQVFRL